MICPLLSRTGETLSDIQMRRPSLAEPLGLRDGHHLALTEPRQHVALGVVQLLRDQLEHRGPHHLLSGIAEDVLGRGIPAGDGAVQSLADDGIARRGHQGGEAGGILVELPERHFSGP
jgi:hypothetical protein